MVAQSRGRRVMTQGAASHRVLEPYQGEEGIYMVQRWTTWMPLCKQGEEDATPEGRLCMR